MDTTRPPKRPYDGQYPGFAEGVKGHRPDRWQEAVALVKSGQVTVSEMARLIGVSKQQVHRWVTNGAPWAESFTRDFRQRYLKDLWSRARP